LPPDNPMEAGVSVAMANEDQTHATTLGGVAPWPVPNAQGQRITSRRSPAPRLLEEVRLADAASVCADGVCGRRGLHQRPAGGACRGDARHCCAESRLPAGSRRPARADAVIESLDDLSEAVVDPALRRALRIREP
jgi:hypothetical protein